MAGWLQEQLQRFGSETGRIDNQIEDALPNWVPTWAKHQFSSATNPLSGLTGDTVSQYYAQRDRGQSSAGARQSATGDLFRSVGLAALAYGGLAAGGAFGAGGAGSAAGADAGAGIGSSSGGFALDSSLGSGLGSGGTFSGALDAGGASAPAFSSAVPSLGGTGTAAFSSAAPDIGGAASSVYAPSGGGGFDWSKLLHNYGSAVQQNGLTGRGSSSMASVPGAGDTGTSPAVAEAIRQSLASALTEQQLASQGITFPTPRYA